MEAQYALRSEASKWIFDSEPLGWKNFTEVDFPEFKAFGYRILLPGSLLWLAKLKLYWAILDAHWLCGASLADSPPDHRTASGSRWWFTLPDLGLDVSLDKSYLLYVQRERSTSDLMLAENFR